MALQDENDWLDTSKSTILIGYDMAYLDELGLIV